MNQNRKPSQEVLRRFAPNLRRLRKARGYTQTELARRIGAGINNRYISSCEQELKNITLANLEALAVALECSEQDFFVPVREQQNPAGQQ